MKRALTALAAVSMLLATAACSSGSGEESSATTTTESTVATTTTTASSTAAAATCGTATATFRTVTSANADLPAPELTATCADGTVTVQTNAIPDYPYVATTPGTLTEHDATFGFPVEPTVASTPGEVPRVGPIGVAIDGVPIFGPTEATGGDVLSLNGALSECGSHNGPPGFHLHLFGWADGVQCLFSAEEVESGDPLQVGWSLDGYPIMSGLVCADDACTEALQLTSSWQLTDDSLFASDTWSAHSYVEGSGDLDQCNGRVDEDGQYRYYTTPTFPYYLGCYRGDLLDESGAGGAGPGGGQGGGMAPPSA